MSGKKEVLGEFLVSSVTFLLLLVAVSGLWFTREYFPKKVVWFSITLILIVILLWFFKDKLFGLLKKKKVVGNKKTYDNVITLIKIVALLKIVSIHYAWWSDVYVKFFYFNGFMLRMFVIASGFGFTMLYLKTHHGVLQLLKHQLRKIYLGVLVALFAILFGLVFKPSGVKFIIYIRDVLMVLLGLFVEEPRMLVNYLLTTFQIERYPATNGALWFISLVIWLYLLHEPIIWLFRKVRAEVALALLFIPSYLVSGLFEFPHKTIVYNLFYFAFGVYFALHYEEFRKMLQIKSIGFILVLLTIGLWFLAEFRVYHYLFELFMFLALYSVFSQFVNIKLNKNVDRTLLFVYLIHQPFMPYLSFLIWKNEFSLWRNMLQYLVFLLLVIGVAYLLGLVFKKLYEYNEEHHLF
jgi:hypothetical protein